MSEERLVKYRFFPAWSDEREERWLEEMAAGGWHLVSGGIRFVFERGEPGQVRYRLDYRTRYPQGKGEYFSLFRDAGWEHVGDFGSWHYFRSPESAGAPEVFTDAESRAAKYRNLLYLLGALLFMNFATLRNSLHAASRRGLGDLSMVLLVLHSLCVAFLFYAAVRIALHMRRIKRERAVR